MRVESMRYFLAVAESGSYSLASRKLYLSQQGLGKSIRALEQELDVALFEKSGRRVHLTEAGEKLLPMARQYVAVDQEIRREMAALSPKRQVGERISIRVTPYVSNALFNFLKVELGQWGLRGAHIVECDLPEAVEEVLGPNPSCALALVAATPPYIEELRDRTGLEFDALVESDLGIIGTSDLLSPRRRFISAKEVASLPVASYNEEFLNALVRRAFAGIPLENKVAHTTNFSLIEELVGEGRAVTFWDSFSSYLSAEEDPRIFIPIKPSVPFLLGAAYLPDRLDCGSRQYLEKLKACVSERCVAYCSHRRSQVHE